MHKTREIDDGQETGGSTVNSPVKRTTRTTTAKRKAAKEKPEQVKQNEPAPIPPKAKQPTRRALLAKITPPKVAPKSKEFEEAEESGGSAASSPVKRSNAKKVPAKRKVVKKKPEQVKQNEPTQVPPKTKQSTRRVPAAKVSPPPTTPSPEVAPEEAPEETPIDTLEEASDEMDEDKTVVEVKKIDFAKINVDRVINQSDDMKSITFKAVYEDQPAVLIFEKTPFSEALTRGVLNDKELVATLDFANDKYHSYMIGLTAGSLSDLKSTFIWPANDTIISKYSRAETVFVSETPDVYNKIVEPYVKRFLSEPDEDPNRWVYNILEGKAEQDRIVINDPDPESGFVLTKNLKSTDDDENLYLLAICHRRDIRSLRDLNDQHLTLLKNILTKGTKAVKDKFKKYKGQLRLFVHYQPTFYHFHVHFKAVEPSNYHSSDRDHLLSTIISNLTLNKDYYKKSTITYPLEHTSALFQELKKAKKV